MHEKIIIPFKDMLSRGDIDKEQILRLSEFSKKNCDGDQWEIDEEMNNFFKGVVPEAQAMNIFQEHIMVAFDKVYNGELDPEDLPPGEAVVFGAGDATIETIDFFRITPSEIKVSEKGDVSYKDGAIIIGFTWHKETTPTTDTD